jgi:lipid-A-disaccharide synthase
MKKIKKVMIIAGEASGDLHGSNLAKEIKQLAPDIKLIGMGGKKMQQAGVELLADVTDLAVCGFFEIIRYLPQFFLLFSSIKKALLEQKPDLLLLIDFPSFNLKIAKIAHQYKIKVLYYISPQLWAWHTSRIKKIKRYVTMMAVIFPFEVDFYRHYAVPVKYVGHPLVEVFAKMPPPSTFPILQKIIIGLLPGSRKNEIKYILPTLIATAQLIQQQLSDIEFVLPLANTITKEEIECQIMHTRLPIKIITAHRYDAMRQCQVVIAASGTVTLELALLGTPLVIVYKGNPLSFMLAKRLVKIPHVGLCNIIAGKKIAEELLQNDATPERIWKEVKRLIEDKDYREGQKAALTKVAQRLSLEKECSIAQLACDVLNQN